MFCPNCGTQNEEAATTCKKCGFNLKGAAAPKFKGTMLMMNAPGAAAPGAPAPRPGGPPGAPGAPPPAGPPGGMPGGMPGGAPGGAAPRPQLKGTMLGVAPPSMGGAPMPGAGHAPAGPPGGFGAPPPAEPLPAAHAPQQPAPGVNPLGGTMVADPAGMGFNPYGGQQAGPYGAPPGAPPGPPQGGPPGPPPGGGYGGPPPGGGYGGPPQGGPPPGPPGGGYGGPPPGPPGGGYGGPPPGMGGPPPGGGYGGPPQGGPPPGMGGPPGAFPGAPQQAPGAYGPPPGAGPQHGMPPGAMMPHGAAPMMGPGGARGPIGQTRNPVVVFLVSMLCFVYAFMQIWGMLNELKAFRGKDDINPIMFFIPILNIINVWNLPPKILEAKQMAGVPNAQVAHPVLYLFLSLWFLPNDLNEIWRAAGGAR